MKFIFALFFSAIISQSFGQTFINDKNAVLRNIGDFSSIKASGGIEIFLSQSNGYALAVSATEEKYRNNIKTEIKDGQLNIWYDGNTSFLKDDHKLRVYVSFKNIESIEGSGACNFIINNTLTESSLRIILSGACAMKGGIDVNNLDVKLSGASTLKVSGKADNIKISASGASDFKNYSFTTNNCIAKLSGASDVKMKVTNSLTVKASGASTFQYKGNPTKKEVNESGASKVSQRE